MTDYRKAKKLSVVEAAYLAGFIDGEGTVTLTKRQKKGLRHIAITISNTERDLLENVIVITGVGKITNKKVLQRHHLPSFAYQVYNRQALDVLKQVAPFMMGYKKDRALLALSEYVRLTPRNGKYSLRMKEDREAFVSTFLAIKPVVKI